LNPKLSGPVEVYVFSEYYFHENAFFIIQKSTKKRRKLNKSGSKILSILSFQLATWFEL